MHYSHTWRLSVSRRPNHELKRARAPGSSMRAGEACAVEKKGTCMRVRSIELGRCSSLASAARAGGRPASQLEKNARALLLHLARPAIHPPLDPLIDRSIDRQIGGSRMDILAIRPCMAGRPAMYKGC
jgi:hypothetical protein